MTPEIYPKNKVHFLKLIPFAKKILSICNEDGISPILYGSFAHFFYVKDRGLEVNDIDIYIPENSFIKIMAALKKHRIWYKYNSKWHTLVIRRGKLRVELDSLEFWYLFR